MEKSASNRCGLGWTGWLIVAGALLLRLYYIDIAQIDVPLRADAGQYVRIALNVLHHGTFSTAPPGAPSVPPDSYRGPGYPALLAVVIGIFGSVENAYYPILILQCLLGAATVGLSILLALRFMRKRYAYVAGMGVALWPHLITLEGYVLTETVFGFLTIAGSWFLAEAIAGSRIRQFVLAAVAFGLAALVNQIILGFSLPLAIWLGCSKGRRRAAAVFAILALGPATLWAVRDAHTPSPPRMSGASRLFENVLIGMEPHFVPRYREGADAPEAIAARARIEAGLQTFSENHAIAVKDAWHRVSAEPAATVAWYLSKPALFWTWSILQGAGDVYVYEMRVAPFDSQPLLRIIAAVCHGLNSLLMFAAFLGLLALMYQRNANPAAVTVAMVFLFATVIHSILAPDARYAVPFRPFEIILAIFALQVAAQWISRMRRDSSRRTQRAGPGAEPPQPSGA